MAMKLQFLAPSYIALNEEIGYHPPLVELLQAQEVHEFEVRLAQIAAYCEVILDGYYMPSELERLADILWNRLREKRGMPVIVTSDSFSASTH